MVNIEMLNAIFKEQPPSAAKSNHAVKLSTHIQTKHKKIYQIQRVDF